MISKITLTLALAFLLLSGCGSELVDDDMDDVADVHDDSGATCDLGACVTACLDGGFIGGTCEGYTCTCISGGDGDADGDAEPDDGRIDDVDAGADADADTDADADGGADGPGADADADADDGGLPGWTGASCLAACTAECQELGDPYADWTSAPLRGIDGFCPIYTDPGFPDGTCTQVEDDGSVCYCVCVDVARPASAASYILIPWSGDA